MRPHFEDKKLIYGTGSFKSAQRVLTESGGTKPLIATTPFYSVSGAFTKFTDSLDTDYQVFNELTDGPPLPEVEHLAEAYRNMDCDSVISYGNSSVIWASKLLKYYFAHDALHLAVPTTLTISAFSGRAEYRMGDEISFVVDSKLTPDAVILDPETSLETENSLWLTSGLGVMDYAMSNLSRMDISPATEDLLLSTIESLIINLPGKSMESRMESMLSTWYSSIDDYGVGEDPLMKIRSSLKSSLDVPDEIVSSFTLPLSTFLASSKNPERLSLLAARLGFKGDNTGELSGKVLELVRGLMRKVGIRSILSDYGITDRDLEESLNGLPLEKKARDSIISSLSG